MAKDDNALRGKINDTLQAAENDGNWKKIYDGTLGMSGATATPPPIQPLLRPTDGMGRSDPAHPVRPDPRCGRRGPT